MDPTSAARPAGAADDTAPAAGTDDLPALRPVELTAAGLRLPAFDEGSGVPVVCLHGMLGDRRTWAAFARVASRTHRVITYTQRYFGEAPWPDSGRLFTTAGHARDLVEVVEALDQGPVHVMGWGYGGAVAALAARARPALFRSLTLHDPMLPSVIDATARATGPVGAYRREAAALLSRVRSGDPMGAARRLIELTMSLEPGQFDARASALQRALVETNHRSLGLQLALPLAPITTGDFQALVRRGLPVKLTRAGRTTAYYRAVTDALLDVEPGLLTCALPELGHWGPAVDPERLAASVVPFFQRVERA